jgi:hypothetical protein
MIALLSLTSCRDDSHTAAELRAPEAMLVVASSERLTRLRGHCPITDFLVTAVKPRETIVDAQGCAEQVADTTYYLYLDRTGKPLVAGRTFPLHPETVGRAFIVSRPRLERLTDSAIAGLSTRFGPSARCSSEGDYQPHLGRLLRWDGEDFGVLLSEQYDEYRSSLTVEVHAGEPSCARLAGQPASD